MMKKALSFSLASSLLAVTLVGLACAPAAPEIVKILLQNGADTNAVNMYGRTALEIAERKGHHGVAILIRNHCEGAELKTGT